VRIADNGIPIETDVINVRQIDFAELERFFDGFHRKSAVMLLAVQSLLFYGEYDTPVL
jgi:hypothetical protein